jgi:putative nucleotidyltransferase with HDIG domain
MTDAPKAMSLANLRELPSLPQVIIDLQSAISREDVSIDAIAETVSLDQALSAKALRVANCSFYGVPGRVVSIRQAIGMLGLRSVSTVLTISAVSQSIPRPSCPGFDMERYWRHSVAVALCARNIARALRLDADVAFTAGLLHDLGRLALASQEPACLSESLRRRDELDCTMLEAERATLGTDHTALGGQVAERWHFGPAVVDAIRLHHEPPASAQATVVDIVHVADSIAHALDVAGDPNEMVPALDPTAWNRAGLSEGQTLLILKDTEAEVDGLCEALAV